jgi:hypothetical protein
MVQYRTTHMSRMKQVPLGSTGGDRDREELLRQWLKRRTKIVANVGWKFEHAFSKKPVSAKEGLMAEDDVFDIILWASHPLSACVVSERTRQAFCQPGDAHYGALHGRGGGAFCMDEAANYKNRSHTNKTGD